MPGGFRFTVDPADALFVYDKKQLRKVMRQAGQEVAALAKRLIRTSAGGPGQPPVNRTGDLIRGIVVSPFRNGEGVRIYDQAADAKGFPYALALEAGSIGGGPGGKRTGSHRKGQYQQHGKRVVQPRPFLSVALAQRETSIADRVQDAVVNGVAFKKAKP